MARGRSVGPVWSIRCCSIGAIFGTRARYAAGTDPEAARFALASGYLMSAPPALAAAIARVAVLPSALAATIVLVAILPSALAAAISLSLFHRQSYFRA